jgi:hypothetical protein
MEFEQAAKARGCIVGACLCVSEGVEYGIDGPELVGKTGRTFRGTGRETDQLGGDEPGSKRLAGTT